MDIHLFRLFLLDSWPRVTENQYCVNHDLRSNVSSQMDCQQLCLTADTCVGIAYSKKASSNHYCYICIDDKLSLAGNGFAFYGKQGETSVD